MTMFRDLMPEVSGPTMMTDNWWARYGLEESALDHATELSEDELNNMPAHDRLAALLSGIPTECDGCGNDMIVKTLDNDGTLIGDECPSCEYYTTRYLPGEEPS